MCKQISFKSFQNEIAKKNYSLMNYVYINLNVCQQMMDVKLLHSNTWNHLTVCKQMINIK